MSLLDRLFGRSPPAAPPSVPPSQTDEEALSRTMEIGTQSTTRSELVRMLARDTLRYSGVPEGWVDCHVLIVASTSGRTSLHARLMVRHWDDNLAKYAVAFQRRLMGEIERFEPQAAEWLGSITWQYMDDCGCPHLDMPDVDTWQAFAGMKVPPPVPPAPAPLGTVPLVPLLTSEPDPADELEEDLAKLFAVRDAEIAAVSRNLPPGVVDFQPTQPGER